MAKYAAIECWEEHGTVRENFNHDVGFTANVILRCTWANRLPLMLELLSNQAYPYPNTPVGWTTPYPITVDITPAPTKYQTDVDEQVIEYEHALLNVQYGYIDVTVSPVNPGDPGSDEETRFTENIEPATDFVTVDHKTFRWTDEDVDALDEGVSINFDKLVPVEEGEVPGKIVRQYNLVRQYFNVRSLRGDILTLPGKVNKERYNSNILGLSFPPETLLFKDPSMQRSFTTEGKKGWTLTLRFGIKLQGWNKFWRPSSEIWSRLIRIKEAEGGSATNVVEGADIYNPYPLGDFSFWLR